MESLTLYKLPQSVGSELRLYEDDDHTKYVKCRYVHVNFCNPNIRVLRWYFRAIDFDKDGNMILDRRMVAEENVDIVRPKKGQSALDTMPKSFA